MLVNLIENAIRHSPEGGTINVLVQPSAGAIELRIADAGPGIPEELRTRVFERFVSAGEGSTRANHGLGLAFCKVAVEAHGGQIWIEDASPGAVFCFTVSGAG